MTIKRALIGLLAILSILLIASQAIMFNAAYQDYQKAAHTLEENDVVNQLLVAASQWAMERGLTSTALNLPDPAGEEMIQKIAALRQTSTQALQNALDKAATSGLSVDDSYKQNIEAMNQRVAQLRASVDEAVKRPKADRDPKLAENWMPAIIALIVETQKLRINLSTQLMEEEAILGKDAIIRQNVWVMTEYVGRERGMIASAIAAGEPLDQAKLLQLAQYRGRVEESWNTLAGVYFSEEEKAEFDAPIAAVKADLFNSYEQARQKVFSDSKLGYGYSISLKDWLERSTQTIDTLLKLQEISGKWTESVLLRIEHEDNMEMLVSSAMILIAVAAAIAGIWITISRVIRPINAMCGSMETIAGGEYEQEVPYLARKDEMGLMAKSVEVFRLNGVEKLRLEAQAKETERHAQEEKKKMMRKLATDFEESVRGIITTVAAAATQLYQTAEGMQRTVANVNQQSGTAAAASQQTSSNVQNVSAAVEEMSASVKEIANQVAKSTTLVGETVTRTGQADQTTQALSGAVEQISGILQMIQDIAGQINLLALNATIESARAGDAGKGFAVVASEVKNLAGQTTKATEEISKQISNVQQASKEVVEVLKGIQDGIGSINQYSSGIASAVEEQSAATREISSNMQNASTGVQEIASNIAHITKGATEADHAAQEVLSAAQMLSKQSEMLNQQVKSFIDGIAA